MLVFWHPATTLAQSNPGSQPQLLIPPNADGPTEVYVDIGISEIFNINAQDEIFTVDAYLFMAWEDNRLAFDANDFGYERKVYQDETALEMLKTEIWWPSFEIMDARGSRDRMHTTLTVFDDGFVTYQERFTVQIEQGFDLTDFPFDEHLISFRIEPFEHAADEVIFVPIDDTFDDEWETEEWDITYTPLVVETGGDDVGYASATAEIEIARIPNFYLSNFVLPMLLIVSISWAVFWMDYGNMHLADRMSVSFTSVLTIVAFDFVNSDSLPTLSYSTLLDQTLTVSYIFLALAVLENVIGYSLVQRKGDPAAANRLDRLSRTFFPIGYFVALVGAFIF